MYEVTKTSVGDIGTGWLKVVNIYHNLFTLSEIYSQAVSCSYILAN